MPNDIPIRAVHFGEIRAAIQDLWYRRRMGRIQNWSGGSQPAPGQRIVRSDMNDLRSWVNEYEVSSGLIDPQGIVSLLFNPLVKNPSGHQGPYTINTAWAGDVENLKPTGEDLLVRTTILANEDTNDIMSYVSNIRTAVSHYSDRGISVAGVLGGEFDRFDKIEAGDRFTYCPNRGLGYQGDLLENEYIDHFVSRATQFASAVASS